MMVYQVYISFELGGLSWTGFALVSVVVLSAINLFRQNRNATTWCINSHIVGLVHKNHIIQVNEILLSIE